MTEKTKFEIEPAPAPPFDFAYIASHWLVLDNMPGLAPLGEVGVRPQGVWFLELIELEDETGEIDRHGLPLNGPTGEFGIRLYSVGGGEVEINSEQSIALEKIIKRIEGKISKAGHPTSSDQMIDAIGKPAGQKDNSIIAVPEWARKR